MSTKLDPVKREICGQHSGWNAHNRHGESQCAPCLRAKADYMLDYRRRKGLTLSRLYTPAEIEEIQRLAAVEAQRAVSTATLTRKASRIKNGRRS
jgi:hypothetical protein